MTENEGCAETDCCKNTDAEAIEARKQEEKMLIANAVGSCMKSTDPLALIAQLALTVVELQKDQTNFEKAIGEHLARLMQGIDQQMRQIMGAINGNQGAPTGKPANLRPVPPVNGGAQPQSPAA